MDTHVENEPVVAPVEGDIGFELGATAPPRESFRPLVAVLAAFSLFYFFAMTRLVRGDLLNSYPFLSNDGYDWLVEGLAVSRWLDGIPIPELPTARNPGFVGVVFGDYHIGADGDLMFAIIAAGLFASLAVIVLLGWWEKIPRYLVGGLIFVLAVSPLGYYRMWILSDQVAVALMMGAAVALHPYVTRGDRKWLVVAALAATLGGLTQLYALIPFLVVSGWCLAVSVWRRKPDYLLGAALIAVPLTTVILVKVWLARVPHASVPRPLSFIDLNFNMFDFYVNAWSFAFLPLLPLLVLLAIYRRREVASSPILTGYWLAVLALMAATFFYQVEDFRFTVPTGLMLGLAILATLPGERPLPRPRELVLATVLLAVFFGIFLAPESYWRPQWSDIEIDTSNNYLSRLVSLEPRDRFALAVHCDTISFCPEVPIRPRISDYRRTRIEIYRYLDSADQSTPLAAYYDQIHPGVLEFTNSNACCDVDASISHGLPDGHSVAGDWDGLPRHNIPGRNTGADTSGVFRAGVWFLRNTNSESPAEVELAFGESGDIAVAGNWDGNRTDTIGAFRDGLWSLRNSNSPGPADLEFVFGQSGDIPVVGDWDGDGVDTVGVFRDGRWLLRNSNDAGLADIVLDLGELGDIPIAGDWDGDGIDTPGMFTGGRWRLWNTFEGGLPDLDFNFGQSDGFPLIGDWNNDGVDTVAVAG